MLSILLPSARKATPDTAQSCWGDLRVALASILAYAPEYEVIVGWNSLEEPRDLPRLPNMRLLRQAPGITTGSEAWNWCAEQTQADQLLFLGDDCVLHPDTIRLMLQDVDTIHKELPDRRIGFLGARSNYVKGPQNIRSPNSGQLLGNSMAHTSEARIIEVSMVVPVAAWIEHRVFDEVGSFPRTNWFADDLICWDLRNLGYNHFVSRAYVHHVGERGTGQVGGQQSLLEKGVLWLKENRPDFYELYIKARLQQNGR